MFSMLLLAETRTWRRENQAFQVAVLQELEMLTFEKFYRINLALQTKPLKSAIKELAHFAAHPRMRSLSPPPPALPPPTVCVCIYSP